MWAVPTDITSLKGNFIYRTKRTISQKGLENSSAKLLPQGTILITSRATIGSCAINKVPMATNQGFQSLICNSNNDNIFMFYAITFNKNKLERLSRGTTFLEIAKTSILKVTLPCPPLPEQQKIASILSTLDELIQNRSNHRANSKTQERAYAEIVD
jgi:type I restriction enzyme S subunit